MNISYSWHEIMKRIKRIIIHLFVIALGLTAGAGCYHHAMLYERQQARARETVTYPAPTPEAAEEQEIGSVICTNKVFLHTKNPKSDYADVRMEEYYDSLGLLAACVEAEAGNQSLLGKRLVVDVVLNRVDDPDWPDTIEGVITQSGQFTTWESGAINRADPSTESYEAVRLEMEDRLCRDIFYFTAGGYGAYGTPWGCVEDHYFSGK